MAKGIARRAAIAAVLSLLAILSGTRPAAAGLAHGNLRVRSEPDQQALRRDGGSDPVGIRSMVTYVIQSYGANANRVYVTGASSGAMMTNVMIGNYPDVFKAGAAFMGVPHSCFASTDGSMWNTQCANGQRIMTPQQWGDLARNAFPRYGGARPRMQLWHGTADTTLRFPNLGEEIKQWTNVLGLSQTPSFTDTPQSGWTRQRFGGTGIGAPVEAITINGVGHSLPLAGQAAMAIQCATGVQRAGSRYIQRLVQKKDKRAGVSDAFSEVIPGVIDVSASNLSTEWLAGGYLASMRDLARWGSALRRGQVVAHDSLAFMQQWRPAMSGLSVGHGLFRTDHAGGAVTIGHDGGVLGYSAMLFWAEGVDATVAIACNVGASHSGPVAGLSLLVESKPIIAALAAQLASS